MTYSGDYTYSYVPTNAAEYPAIGHDRRYDRLDINGLKGLLTDPRASGADMRYVFENMAIAYFPGPGYSLTERANAWILGAGLGVMALPKTVIQLSKTNGLIEMLMWYKISNAGVTNVPSDYWYHIYFYYKDENKLLNTWVRQLNKENTTFAFVAVNDGLTLGNWKRVNKDFSSKENELVKEKFEKQILNKIKAMVK